jgi:transcriptional regulator GlxA family with amidase domain
MPLHQYIYQRIVQAKLFMDEHYDAALRLEAIAAKACLSKFHFIRLFKTIYGRTPNQYLTAVRIQKARELLQQGESIENACWQVGFQSPGSFKTLFKRTERLSPGAYRRLHAEKTKKWAATPAAFIPACLLTQKRNFRDHSGGKPG